MSLPPEDVIALSQLLDASIPVLRIKSGQARPWCRKMREPGDRRVGPWSYVFDFEVLDEAAWKAEREVLYLLIDAAGRLCHVGESTKSLSTRWRLSPMFSVGLAEPLGAHALFHSTVTAHLDQRCASRQGFPYTVLALFAEDLARVMSSAPGSVSAVLTRPRTVRKTLAWHTESWVCALAHDEMLWNTGKVPGARRRVRSPAAVERQSPI